MTFALAGDVKLLNIVPNWSEKYSVALEYKTDIVTTRGGQEQRRSLRRTSRRTLSFKSTMVGSQVRKFDMTMRAWQGRRFAIPDYTRSMFVAADVGTIDTVIHVDGLPAWAEVGVPIMLMNEDASLSSFGFIAALGSSTITLQSVVGATWPAGTEIRRVQVGKLAVSFDTSRATNETCEVSLDFAVEPGSEAYIEPPAASTFYLGSELFSMAPNWATPMTATAQANPEVMDYGFGVITYFEPQLFRQEIWQSTFLVQDEGLAAIEQFHARCRGRRGSFFAPTWRADLKIIASFADSATTLLFEGPELTALLASDSASKDIAIIGNDFSVHPYRISSLSAVGTNSQAILSAPMPAGYTIDDVMMVCWLPKWRLGSDILTMDYVSSTVAQFQLNMISLESDA